MLSLSLSLSLSLGDSEGVDGQDLPTVEYPAYPLYVREKVHPGAFVDSLKKDPDAAEGKLFDDFNGLSGPDAVYEWYRHKGNWQNRIIHGESGRVMASLAERENLSNQVQMIFFDPPYGIGFKSNFQVSTRKPETAVNRKGLPNDPRTIRAFRDTYERGIHSYLDQIHEKLTFCRDLLAESGSIFVQIGDENVHRMATVLDEVFGADNRVATIPFMTTAGSSSSTLPSVADFLLWYAKDKPLVKYRQLYESLSRAEKVASLTWAARVQLPDGSVRSLTEEERAKPDTHLPPGARVYKRAVLTSQGTSTTGRSEPYHWRVKGRSIVCSVGRQWSVSREGMDRLAELDRLDQITADSPLGWKWFEDEIPGRRINNVWHGKMNAQDKRYVVQTADSVVERCVLMSTDPGDLVFDPTCGGATTALAAEKWGRRWITCDTSPISVAIARQRIATATFKYWTLADSPEGAKAELKLSASTRSKSVSSSLRSRSDSSAIRSRSVSSSTSSRASSAGSSVSVSQDTSFTAKPTAKDSSTTSSLVSSGPDTEARSTGEDVVEVDGLGVVGGSSQETRRLSGEVDADTSGLGEAGVASAGSGERVGVGLFGRGIVRPGVGGYGRDPAKGFVYERVPKVSAKILAYNEVVEPTMLVDRPHAVRGVTRVASPFTVESSSPWSYVPVDGDDSAVVATPVAHGEFVELVIEALLRSPIRADASDGGVSSDIRVVDIESWPGRRLISHLATYTVGTDPVERRAGLLIAPEDSTVTAAMQRAAALDAGTSIGGTELVIVVAFAFEPDTAVSKVGRVKVARVQMHRDLVIRDLSDDLGHQAFVMLGQPDLLVRDEPGGQISVELLGYDTYDPSTGQVKSSSAEVDVACWMIDTDYDGFSFFARRIHFPGAGKDKQMKRLYRELGKTLDRLRWQRTLSLRSAPFDKPTGESGSPGRIAVKIITATGMEMSVVTEIP